MNDTLFRRTGEDSFDKWLKVLVSGPPKSGKTTLLGTVPNILILDTEPHANNLESVRKLNLPYATITSTEDLRYAASVLSSDSLRKQLAQQRYGLQDIEAVAIDTLDTLQKIMKAERMKERRQTDFQRDDWGWLKSEMEAIIQKFTALPMHVFFIVHTKTQEIGKGDDAYTTFLPGLEGAVAQSIAGMVGYSLLSFRKEEVGPNGKFTKYWLQTEGDRTYDYLGTRTGGALPTIIEPNMATIYQAVLDGRAQPAQLPAAPPPPDAPSGPPEGLVPPGQEVAQTPIQTEPPEQPVQTPVETQQAPAQSEVEREPETPPAEKPADSLPVNPAAIGHIKRVYDAIQQPLTDAVTGKLTMGDARNIVKMWQATIQDHQADPSRESTPVTEMTDILRNHGWLDEEGAPAEKPADTEAKVDGTIAQIKAYVGEPPNLERVQEAYDLEMEKGENARKSLISTLEVLGAKPSEPTPAPTEEVQTPVETPSEPVTPEAPAADTQSTEDEAVQTAQEALGATVVSEELAQDAPCEVCSKPIDDYDLAKLGVKRYQKVLCVNDYLAEGKKQAS
jgi:hypothetical protein